MTSAVATVTSKGQVVIPYKIRKKLNISQNKKLLFTLHEEENSFTVRFVPDIISLAGSFSTSQKSTPQEEREFFENHYERT